MFTDRVQVEQQGDRRVVLEMVSPDGAVQTIERLEKRGGDPIPPGRGNVIALESPPRGPPPPLFGIRRGTGLSESGAGPGRSLSAAPKPAPPPLPPVGVGVGAEQNGSATPFYRGRFLPLGCSFPR